MKTYRQHLEELPEPYRSQAIANTPTDLLEAEFEYDNNVLWNAFRWSDSPEGHDYWSDYIKNLKPAARP